MANSVQPALCSIQRAADVVGDRWTLLILREAIFGRTRFVEFQENLGVATDVLSARLARLVEEGVLRREVYRESGSRRRHEYRLTPTGEALYPLVAALGQWGEEYHPVVGGTAPRFSVAASGEPARLAFVSESGKVIDPAGVVVARGTPSVIG